MANTLFDLYFSGKTTGEMEPDDVRLKVGKLFGANDEALKRLFSGKAVRIKSGVDQDTAIKYRVAMREAGALLDIKPQKNGTVEESSTAGTASEDGGALILLPPNTGDLSDCATQAPSFPLPDITNIVLAPAGTTIDESDHAPPLTINTEGLTLAEPNTGSLEDCQPVIEPKPIPGIDHIELASPYGNKNDN